MNKNQIVVSKVDKLHKDGMKKQDAITQVAQELNMTFGACYNKYYLEKEVNSIFSNDERDFIVDTILKFVSKGKKIKEAITYCSDKFNVKYAKVRVVWEQERDKRNLKTRERDTKPWTEKEDEIIVDTLIKESHKNRYMTHIFPEIDIMLDRKEGSTKSRWNNTLRHHHADKIKKLYFQWDEEKDQILLETIQKNSAMKKTLQDAFDEAAEIIQNGCKSYHCRDRYDEKFIANKIELNIQMGFWTKEEDQILKSIMTEEIQKGKTDVDASRKVEEVLKRSHIGCLARWNKFKSDKKSTPRWSEKEDLILIDWVTKSDTIDIGCKQASKKLKNRSYYSCLQRWNKYLKDN